MAPAECLYTDTQNAAGQECPFPPWTTCHRSYSGNNALLGIGCVPTSKGNRRYVFVCLPRLKMNPMPENTEERVIWSWFADLADMQCITFLEFRGGREREKKPYSLMPTGSSNCFDINRSFAENSPNDNTESPFFPFLKGRRSSQVHFYLGLSSLSELLLSPDQCRIEAQPAPRAPLNQHVCIVPTKRNVCALKKKSLEAIVGGEGVGALEEPLPLFSVPCRKGSVSRSWHLPGCGGFEEAVMSAILRWTLQWALCRHLSFFSP